MPEKGGSGDDEGGGCWYRPHSLATMSIQNVSVYLIG